MPSEAARRVQAAFPRLWDRITGEWHRIPPDPQRIRIDTALDEEVVPMRVAILKPSAEEEAVNEEEAAEQEATVLPRVRICTEAR